MLKSASPQTKESTEISPSHLHATPRSTEKTTTSMCKDDGAFGTWESQLDSVDSFQISNYEAFGVALWNKDLCLLSRVGTLHRTVRSCIDYVHRLGSMSMFST